MRNKNLLIVAIIIFVISTITMIVDFLPFWSALLWCASAAYMLGRGIDWIIRRKNKQI